MTARDTLWLTHHRARWMRGDARIHFGPEVVKTLGMKAGKAPTFSTSVLHRSDVETVDEAEASELKFQIAALRLQRVFLRWQLSRKAGFNTAQPRWPKGSGDDSGRWSGDVSSSGMADEQSPIEDAVLDLSDDDLQPILISDSDSGDAPNRPPEIPKEAPATMRGINTVARQAAVWLVAAALAPDEAAQAVVFIKVIEGTLWLSDKIPGIVSYLDRPKTLDELMEGVGQNKSGYEDHHIVEKTLAEKAGYPKSMIEGPDNLVSVPKLKHENISNWYSTKQEKYGGLTPRDYLRDKSWDEWRNVGLEALVREGVLKP